MPQNTSTTTYVIYARKSEENDERQVQSIGDQIRDLETLAENHSLTVAKIFTEEKSAKTPQTRPVLEEMLAFLEEGRASAILVWNLNRLARNPVDAGTIQWMLMQGRISEIRTPDRRYLPEDNVLLFSVETSMATQYVRDLSKGVIRGLHSKAERGWFPGRAPLGYLNTKTQERGKNTIYVDKKRFPLVRRAFDLLLSGEHPPRRILRILNEDYGLRSPKRGKSGGTPVSLSSLYKIYSNPFYMGAFEYGGKIYDGRHRAMITPDEYDRVQSILGRKGKPLRCTHSYAYAGLLRCGECGGVITATTIKKTRRSDGKRSTFAYYYCHRARRTKGEACSETRFLNAEALTNMLQAEIEKLKLNRRIVDWSIQVLYRDEANQAEVAEKIQEAQERAEQAIEDERRNLRRMRMREQITDAELEEEKRRLDLEVLKLKKGGGAEMRKALDLDRLTAWALQFALHAREAFKEGGVRAQQRVLQAICSNRTLKDQRPLLRFRKWVTRLQEGVESLASQLTALEPSKYRSAESQKTPPPELIPHLCALVDAVQTEINTGREEVEAVLSIDGSTKHLHSQGPCRRLVPK